MLIPPRLPGHKELAKQEALVQHFGSIPSDSDQLKSRNLVHLQSLSLLLLRREAETSYNYHSPSYEVYVLHYQLRSADHICTLREFLLTFKAQSNAQLQNNQMFGAGQGEERKQVCLKHMKEQFS